MSCQRTIIRALARVALGAIFAGGASIPSMAQNAPDDTPKVNIGGTIFADYTYQDAPTAKDSDGNTIHPNSFNDSRTYINVTGNISHLVSFRITPDISRQANGDYAFRLKYGFGQINLDDWLPKGSWVRFGQQQTPYIDYWEGIYRYRFQGPTFVDYMGFLTSSDIGISGHVNFPDNYGDVHLGVYNGEGYHAGEANNQKGFEIRASLRPAPQVAVLKGLRVTGFYQADHYVESAERNRFIANASFESSFLVAGFEYLDAKDQTSVTKPEVHAQGWSVFATPRTPIGIEALIRYDSLEPDKDFSNQKKKQFIAGIAYWFPVTGHGVSAAVMLDYDNVKYENFPVGNANFKPEEKRYALHTLFNF
jgi:hypothetical protein